MLQDFFHSIRALAKRPGFTALAIFTIALGVAVNTSMFSIVNGVLWKPFPYPDADRLVRFNERSPAGDLNNSAPNAADWKARSNVLEDVALYRFFPAPTLLLPDRNTPVTAAYTHANLFRVLRAQPALGRLFTDDDDARGAQAVAVITDAAWSKYFGRDASILNKPVRVAANGADTLTVVGILPEGFSYDTVEFWIPLNRFPMPPDTMRDNHWFAAVGRLNPGVSLQRAVVELGRVSEVLEKENPKTNKGIRVELQSLADYYAGRTKTPLLILFWAVAMVMLIACGNVVHLVLTRTLSRGREMAVRAALGARGLRLTWLLLSEGLVLSAVGGALGVVVAQWVVTAAIKAQPGLLPQNRVVTLDREAVAYAIGTTLFTALLLALIPVWRVLRTNVRDALHAAGRSSSSGRKQTGGWIMIAGEIAIACVLLVGAGMMIQALRNLSRIDVGYDPNGLISVSLATPAGKRYTEQSAQALLTQVREAAQSVPGYRSSAMAASFGVGGNGMLGPVVIPGRSNPSTPPLVPAMEVTPDFFETMRIPLKQGRAFSTVQPSVPEVIVNEEFVRRFLPDENPIGRRVSVWSTVDIVGVVGNSRLQGDLTEVKPEVYMSGGISSSPTLLVRVLGQAENAAPVLRERLKAIDPGLRVGTPRTLVGREAARTVIERFTRSLLTIFAVLALVLACLGIYGVASYSVAERTHEIGVRMALGASRANVTRLVMQRTLFATAAGAMVGILGAAALARFVRNQLYEASVWNPAAVISVVGVLALVALIASAVPMLRAARVDPAISLRQD